MNRAAYRVGQTREAFRLGEDPYYSLVKRDRLIHIVAADPASCEALSVLFRLEGFQTSFSLDAASFLAGFEDRSPIQLDYEGIGVTGGS